MTCGVPQGSILSPLLFILFVNDALQLPLHGTLKMYADDSAVIYNEKDMNDLETKMNADLKVLYDWFASNKLAMNLKKTQYIIFRPRNCRRDSSNFSIKLDAANELERVSVIKCLGLWLDERLNWNEHINFVAKKMAPFVGVLGRMKNLVDEKTLKLIYHAHIHSHLLYMCHIWSVAAGVRLKQLEVLQNKAVRRIFHRQYLQSPDVHTVDLYNSHKILPLSK